MKTQISEKLFDISEAMQQTMRRLEEIDERDRQDGTPRAQRLRQVPAESGMLLALLAKSAPPGSLVEIGTSAGYSALWISLAAKQRAQRLHTFEILPEKAAIAQQTFADAGVEEWLHLSTADARSATSELQDISFCFLDADKDVYTEIYDLLIPKLVDGGLLIADNVVSHATELNPFVKMARMDKRVDALVLPVGKGLLVCRKLED
jgi:predicted O-methyltransferase YrrM